MKLLSDNYDKQLDQFVIGVIAEVTKEHNQAIERLTQTQLADAVKQAILSGDFIKYTAADAQKIVYIPGAEAERWKTLYHELLFAVSNKYPDETRHQTALRYIRLAETTGNGNDCGSISK